MNTKNTARIVILLLIAAAGFLSKGKIDVAQLVALLGAQTETPGVAAHTASAPAPEQTGNAPNDGFLTLQSMEIPVCGAASHAHDHEIRVFKNYAICYRESYEQPEWAAYLLTKEMLAKNAARSNDFRPDPQISTGSATLADYRGSGYSRGHLSPAADFTFDSEAMSETFFMSNMSPQTTGFNSGIWQKLESQVRSWAKRFGHVFVVSGPVLEKSASAYQSIGANNVSVPEYYYKVVLATVKEGSVMALGFIMPNEDRNDSIWKYAVPIDEVERRTNLDFFSLLPDDIEEAVERTSDTTPWR